MIAALCQHRCDAIAGLAVTTGWDTARQAAQHIPVVLDRGRDAAALYGRGPTIYIVRPDRHIGYAGPPDRRKIERYLATVLSNARVTAR